MDSIIAGSVNAINIPAGRFHPKKAFYVGLKNSCHLLKSFVLIPGSAKRFNQNKNDLFGGFEIMSNVNGNNKIGHPVAGIVMGILGIAVALLMTLLFGVIAGAVAGILGIVAVLLGYSARRHGNRGVGAVVFGVLALVLAVSLTFGSVSMMKDLKETAVRSGVAPTISRYMNNPYLGLSSVVVNAVNASKDQDTVKTIQSELEALRKYAADNEKPAAESAPVEG